MRLYSSWIFLGIAFIQLTWYCRDARDWCLWLPGFAICAAGVLADRRPYLCGNALFWIVCLVLYVIAPASQLEGNAFQGPISVIGIRFPDAIIERTVALADGFLGAVFITQLMMRRCSSPGIMERRSAGLCPFPAIAPSPVPAPVAMEPAQSPGPGSAGAETDDHDMEDNQVYILIDDPGEFRYLPDIEEEAPAVDPPAEVAETSTADAADPGSDRVAAILQSRALAMAMLLIGLGIPCAMFLMVGNFEFVANGREFALSAFSDPALGTLVNSFAQDLLVVLCLLAIERYAVRRTADNLMLLAVVAILMLIMVNPFNTARYQVGAVLIMAVLFSCRGRFPMAISYAGMVLYLYAIMPVMNLLRNGLSDIQGQKVALGTDFNTLDYDCFSMFAFAVHRTDIDGFTYGKFLCSSVLFFLPRSWWPDKPRPSSMDLGQYLMQHHSGWFDNLSCPPMGDGYMDFGIAGVICMGALFGYLVECSDQVIDRWSQRTFIGRGLAAAFVAFLPILLRGSLGGVMGFVIAPVVLLISLWLLLRSCQAMRSGAMRPDDHAGLAWKMR